MKSKISEKIIAYIIIFILVFVNSIFFIQPTVNATVEEGKFTTNEWIYNIKIKKVVQSATKDSANNTVYEKYYLDTNGGLWTVNSSGGIKQIFTEHSFSDIAGGKNHCIALDKDGYIWAWGDNTYYQLGNGTTSDASTPIEIYPTKQFKSVYCTEDSSFAIDKDGKIYVWGSNKFKTIQNSTKTIKGESYNDAYGSWYDYISVCETPKPILEENKFEKLSVNNDGVLALDVDGYVWGWGLNKYGELGNYDSNTTVKYHNGHSSATEYKVLETPTKISETIIFKDISKGITHSVLLTTDSKAYTIGYRIYGALGDGNSDANSYSKNLIQPIGLEDIIIKDILACDYTSLFIDDNNNIWSCGNILGNGSSTNSATIVRVKKGEMNPFKFANGESKRTIYVFDLDGNLWGWGTLEEVPKNLLTGIMNTYADAPIQITGEKKEYTVTFMNGTETVKTETVEEGSAATAPELTKAGYTLTWAPDFSNVTSDLTVRAIWTANTNTPYKVEHYLRTTDIEVEGYELQDTENLTRNYRFCSCGKTKNLYRVYRKYKL